VLFPGLEPPTAEEDEEVEFAEMDEDTRKKLGGKRTGKGGKHLC